MKNLQMDDFRKIRPLFITFEGGDGVGKSTQIRLFEKFLSGQGLQVIFTREPGGCENALVLRSLLVEGASDRWDGLSELLLYSAARNEHLRTLIRPSLAKGQWVLCDRFADSTRVYQGAGRGLAEQDLNYINDLVVGSSWPDLTIILDMPAGSGLARARARQEDMLENRFEGIEQAFHERVQKGFLKIAEENPKRCRVVNADGTIEEVQERIQQVFLSFLQEKAA